MQLDMEMPEVGKTDRGYSRHLVMLFLVGGVTVGVVVYVGPMAARTS